MFKVHLKIFINNKECKRNNIDYLKEYQTDGARIAVCSTNPNFDENILDMTDIYKREMIVELKD